MAHSLFKRVRFRHGVIVLLLALLGAASFFGHGLIVRANGYKSKILCSAVFVSMQDPERALNEDLGSGPYAFLKYFTSQILLSPKEVTTSFLGLGARTAVFRNKLGCALAIGASADALRQQPTLSEISYNNSMSQTWPLGEAVDTAAMPTEVNQKKLAHAMATAFEEEASDRRKNTRAVVVVYKGRIIAEQYADGYDSNTPLPGWSMTKSVINALIGILVKQNRLSIHKDQLLAEWKEKGDLRGGITLEHLLQMSSGLAFGENYANPFDDAVTMLFATGDTAGYAAAKPLAAPPGMVWAYSSGTTNILGKVIRQTLGDMQENVDFPYRELFAPLGMRTAVIEPDATGNFIGSSFMFASARDWARFGLLYLQDGMWENKYLLPEGWVSYSTRPAPHAPGGNYGAQIWLDPSESYIDASITPPQLPQDDFYFVGHEGQVISIIPSRKLVVVRLGLTRAEGAWDNPSFVASILDAIQTEN